MDKLMMRLFTLVFFCLLGNWACAQHSLALDNKPKLDLYQDSLAILSEATFEEKDDLAKFEKNAQFVKQLVNALKINGSFNYGFDSLKRISILKSTDNSFRIITWFVPTSEGNYRYYGAIQMSTTNGSLKLHPLTDATSTLLDASSVTTNKNWLGARYYEMIPFITNGKQPYWILLGWKGNNQKTTKKVIEVLSFEKGEPKFGMNLFQTEKNGPLKNRIVFEYSRLNAMTLTVDHKQRMIVFDHLAPYDPKMVGNFEYYGADLTFDAFKLVWGKLTLVEDVELKNDPSPNDAFYGTPVKASKVNIKPIHE